MNAAHPPRQSSTETGDATLSALSALVDGELSPHELDGLFATFDDEGAGLDQWNRYQMVGDVLRGAAPARAARSPADFLAALRPQLQASAPEVARPGRTPLTPSGALDVDRRTAANDALFRWKMVAGVASLAAVLAVSWTMLDVTAGSSGDASRGGELAQGNVPFELSSVNRTIAAEPVQPVVVETPQGPLLRDPQLEALMAQHRQHGGASALQMPTGFLRNATYDAPAR